MEGVFSIWGKALDLNEGEAEPTEAGKRKLDERLDMDEVDEEGDFVMEGAENPSDLPRTYLSARRRRSQQPDNQEGQDEIGRIDLRQDDICVLF